MEGSKIHPVWMLPLVLVLMIVSGCSIGPKTAPDLLAHAEKNVKPLVNNAVIINVEIDSNINNHEEIEKTVKESIEMALNNSNIFGEDSSQKYRIDANILIASQAAFSFGSFEGKLKIHYKLFDPSDNKIFDKTIYTEAGSDQQHFLGAKRHRRSRAVNISKNVLQFIDGLQNHLAE